MRRGEVLIGGPMVCQATVNPNMPDADVEAKNKDDFVTIDGIRYFCTGDVGQFNKQGNLQIIDRKKDLSSCSRASTSRSARSRTCSRTAYVQLPMVAKSTMSYCIALVCPAEPALKALAKGKELAEACKDQAVIDAVTADVKKACKEGNLAKFEVPERVILIDDLWTPDNDMLTAVNKLKRKSIEEKHKAQIDAIYV